MKADWESPCGRVRLWNADARKWISTLAIGCADRVCTDPPYGLDGGKGPIGKRGRAARVSWSDTVDDVRTIYVPVVEAALKLTDGRGIVTPGTPNAFEYPKPRDIGCLYQPCAGGCSSWGRATWQPVLFYGKDPRAGKHLDPTTMTNNQPAEKSAHPCPKPIRVALWMVYRASLEGETILDPFAGVATFAIAAVRLGRSFLGCEIDEKYFEIAVKRIEAELNATPLLDSIVEPEQQTELFTGEVAQSHP